MLCDMPKFELPAELWLEVFSCLDYKTLKNLAVVNVEVEVATALVRHRALSLREAERRLNPPNPRKRSIGKPFELVLKVSVKPLEKLP